MIAEEFFEGYFEVSSNLTRRAAEVNDGAPSGFFYLACVCEDREDFSEPRPLVRLYSIAKWRRAIGADRETTGLEAGDSTVVLKI